MEKRIRTILLPSGLIVLLIVALLTYAVQRMLQPTTPEPSPSPASLLTPTRAPLPPPPPTTKPLQELIAQARTELAQKLALPATAISVKEVRSVIWPDTALGCPQPNKVYLPMLTAGYQILLEARGQLYDYRSDQHKVYLCQQPSASRNPTAATPVESQ